MNFCFPTTNKREISSVLLQIIVLFFIKRNQGLPDNTLLLQQIRMFQEQALAVHIYQHVDQHDPNAESIPLELLSVNKQKINKTKTLITHESLQKFTISSRFAQCTSETASGINELHIWRHVGFASNASYRTEFAEINDWRNDFTFFGFRKWRYN